MNKRIYILLIFIFFSFQSKSQSPCGLVAPPPFDDCSNVCVLCDLSQIDGFTGTSNSYTPDGSASCGMSIENNQWFAFMAAQSSVTLNITMSNCSGSGGLQMVVYEGSCNGNELYCNPSGSTSFITTTFATTIGQTYYVMFDGYAGSICDFSVNAIGGGSVAVDPASTPTGPLLMCANGNGTYTIPPVAGASEYTWDLPAGATINGQPGPVTIQGNAGTSVTVDFGANPNGQICVTPANACNIGTPVCIDIVEKIILPTVLPPVTICNWDQYTFIDGTNYNVDGTMTTTLQTAEGCDSIVTQDLGVIQPVFTNLGKIYLCPGECYYVGAVPFCYDGTYTEFLLSSVYPYCDSIVELEIELIYVDTTITANPGTELNCQTNFIELIASGTNPFFDSTYYYWYDSQGTLVQPDFVYFATDSGTYTLTIEVTEGGHTCTASNEITITKDSDMPIITLSANIIPCNGTTTIQLTSSDYNNLIYQWSGPGITATNINDPSPVVALPGTYFVTVTDIVRLCSQVYSIVVTQSIGGVVAINTINQISCFGLCNGSATASITGGTAPYTYLWNDVNAQTTAIASNLCQGNYIVTVTDAQGCTSSNTVTITRPDSLITSYSTISPACSQSNGQACISIVSGGTAPFSYLWNDQSNQTSACANNIGVGNYTVSITDAHNCVTTQSVAVSNLTGPSVTVNINQTIDCYGVCSGSIQATAIGGNPPYTYLWNDALAQTSSLASQLCVGTYVVSVTDALNCLDVASISISSPDSFITSTTSVNTDCNASNGQACINVSGASAPYSYSWNDPNAQSSACANNLDQGIFQVIVTDQNGCTDSLQVTIASNAGPTSNITILSQNVCASDCNGSMSVIASGGVAPYTYLWNDALGQTNDTALGLCDGVYHVTVSDVYGCTFISTDSLRSPATITSSVTSSNTNCNAATGQVCVQASGGTPPFQFLWSDALNQTTSCAANLPLGIYFVTITDQNGCLKIDSAQIQEFQSPLVSALVDQNTLCASSCDGQAHAIVQNGTAPFTFAWNDPLLQTTANVNQLCAGTYIVEVVDIHQCLSKDTITITSPSNFSAQTQIINSNCNQNDGEICVQITGATPPYSFIWNTGSVDSCLINIPAGYYNLTFTDANLCSDTMSVLLQNNNAATVSAQLVDSISCFAVCDGKAVVRAFGGTPPYTYVWDDPLLQTTDTAFALCAGLYSVTVTESNGCESVRSVTITQPTRLSTTISTNPELCVNACDGLIGITASGSNGGYLYSIDGGINYLSSGQFQNMCGNTYITSVIDQKNCQALDTIQVLSGSFLVDAYIFPEDTICNGINPFTLTSLNSGGVWTGNGITNTNTGLFSPLVAGTGAHQILYTTTVTCGETDTLIIIVKDPYDASILPVDPLCENTDPITLSSNGVGGIWTGIGITNQLPIFDPIVSGIGNHIITHYNPFACGDTQTIVIQVQEIDSIHVTIDSMCSNAPFITLSTLPGGYWAGDGIISGNPGVFSPNFAGAGNHNIIFINPNSCLDSQYVPVYVYDLPSLAIIASDTAGCSPLFVEFFNPDLSSQSCVWNISGQTYTGCDTIDHVFTLPGMYDISLHVENIYGCKNYFTWENLITVQSPPYAEFGFEIHQEQQIIEFINKSENASTYSWNFGSKEENPIYHYPEEQTDFEFCLETQSAFGCIDTICHDAGITPPIYVYIPNTFTPNTNNLNDVFHPIFSISNFKDLDAYFFGIYNRWGDLIFQTNDPKEAWNGEFKGILSQQGVYTWKLFFVYIPSGEEYVKQGQVNLLPGKN